MYAVCRRQKNVDNEAELFTPESDFDSIPARSQEKRQGLLNASGFAFFIADGAEAQCQQFLLLSGEDRSAPFVPKGFI